MYRHIDHTTPAPAEGGEVVHLVADILEGEGDDLHAHAEEVPGHHLLTHTVRAAWQQEAGQHLPEQSPRIFSSICKFPQQ